MRVNYDNDQLAYALANALKERDEAIADRDIARLAAQDSDKAHDRMVGELEKVYRERDEARAVIRLLWERAELHLDLSEEEIDRVNRSWGETK